MEKRAWRAWRIERTPHATPMRQPDAWMIEESLPQRPQRRAHIAASQIIVFRKNGSLQATVAVRT